MPFAHWLLAHEKCKKSRFESGDDEAGIVALCCESGCGEMYINDFFSQLDPAWAAQFKLEPTTDG